MNILIVGCGAMADALKVQCKESSVRFFDSMDKILDTHVDFNETVAVHLGSGRELDSVLNFCESNNLPMVQGSTGQELKSNEVCIPIIDAPNLSLPIVALLGAMPSLSKVLGSLPGVEIFLIESHQSTKKSVPGTAKVIANSFGIEEDKIISIRDNATALSMGVPTEHLDGHGYHWLHVRSNGVVLTLSTKVNGRSTYAQGAIELAKMLVKERNRFDNRVYSITEAMEILSS